MATKRGRSPEIQDVGTVSPKRSRSRSIPVYDWSPKKVFDALLEKGIPEEVGEILNDQQISGKCLSSLSHYDLEMMGISDYKKKRDVLTVVQSLYANVNGMEKVFNDPIHGHIELHPLCVKIMDTPQFQRLRHIKQLGLTYCVFIGASHNRFEHSVGVGYLAGELVETLHRKQPELGITEKDILCVKIAGLCHDLGHGPFSHMFDSRFIPKARPQEEWKHETASVMMFAHLVEVNNLREEFLKYGLDDNDIIFIKEQIAGPTESESSSQQCSHWPYKGRTEEKSFLYEIVANKRNGIDVDKWDYFARDCHCLGIPNNFDMQRHMKFARVIYVKSRRQICTRDKEVGNLYELFHTRSSLHRRAYQHKTVRIIEYMVTEALLKADEYLLIPGENNKPVKMSEAIYDPYAYTRLTDSVIQQILMSTDPQLLESQEILKKLEKRQLYKCIGQTQCSEANKMKTRDDIAEEIINSLSEDDLEGLPRLTTNDLVIEFVTYDYGMNDKDPIECVRFYLKEDQNKAVKVRRDQVSQMLPQTFKEKNIRMYCKSLDRVSVEAAQKYFRSWCQKYACITPRGDNKTYNSDDEEEMNDNSFTMYATPIKDKELMGGLKPKDNTRTKRKIF